MMRIPFTKAHGAKNDFLLTWEHDLSQAATPEMAREICHRNTGIGADGWLIVRPPGAITLFNADGSLSEISGNGTRCAAAFLIENGHATTDVRVMTGAGEKWLRVLKRDGLWFEFEMEMGKPVVAEGELRTTLPLSTGDQEVTIINVGNPQCAVFVDNFDFDWQAMGKEIEWHSRFPNRTNVSFVKVLDRKSIDVRFWERGVGETNSSGTGSTGAMASAVLRQLIDTDVLVLTPAGGLKLKWNETIYLEGPAELVARREFFRPTKSRRQ